MQKDGLCPREHRPWLRDGVGTALPAGQGLQAPVAQQRLWRLRTKAPGTLARNTFACSAVSQVRGDSFVRKIQIRLSYYMYAFWHIHCVSAAIKSRTITLLK